MTKQLQVKTTRAKYGTAALTLTRFFNYSTMKVGYSCQFYNTKKFFDRHKDMVDYILANYEIASNWYSTPEEVIESLKDRKSFWGLK